MNTSQSQKHDEEIARFRKAMAKRFPTMAGIVSLGSDASRAMREDNRKRRIAALQKRAQKET